MEESLNGRFPPTRHSIIAAVQSDDCAEKARALDAITAAYWKPIYKYVRLRWSLSPEDAQDLTQEFFARLIEKDFLSGYDAGRGRLRTFLRTCADRLFLKQSRDERRLKRGGAGPALLDSDEDSDEAERELARVSLANPDSMAEFFEREWVRSLFALAVERLRDTCARSGKTLHFELFARYDLADDEAAQLSYAQLAAEYGLSLSTVTNYLASARRDFRHCVLEQLRDMTATDEEFQREARELLGVKAT
jgi:RNA polymerase sigma factor (sigma-70 family)